MVNLIDSGFFNSTKQKGNGLNGPMVCIYSYSVWEVSNNDKDRNEPCRGESCTPVHSYPWR